MEQITKEEAKLILTNAPVAHLGVVIDDAPYVTPMSFVFDGDRILFRTMAGRKLEAMRANPSVCVEVARYDETTGDWVSVIITGQAKEVDDEELGAKAVDMLLEKYRSVLGSPLSRGGIQPIIGLPHVVEILIDDITGMASGRGWGHRTKPGRL